MLKKKPLVKKNLSKPNGAKSVYNMYATNLTHGEENCCNGKYGLNCKGQSFGTADCCNNV